MPGKNLVKDYIVDSYYHVYNRGANKQSIFIDDQDHVVFMGLLKRYLGDRTEKKVNRQDHPNYHRDIELLAFCLMGNHFHMFLYQINDPVAITKLMRSLTTSYSMYFNKKYKRVGPVFQQRYRAVRITDDAQLTHITRYIHLNPKNYKEYKWSSYPYYLGKKASAGLWLRPNRVLELFEGDYEVFVNEYKDTKDEIEYLKSTLADSI